MNKQERTMQEAQEKLRKIFEGMTEQVVYTKVVHVSRSGMLRIINAYIIEDNQPRNISWLIAEAVGWKYQDKYPEGVKVSGCGMDMGFHLVYTLSSYLYKRNGRDDQPNDGGYNIKQRWL